MICFPSANVHKIFHLHLLFLLFFERKRPEFNDYVCEINVRPVKFHVYTSKKPFPEPKRASLLLKS